MMEMWRQAKGCTTVICFNNLYEDCVIKQDIQPQNNTTLKGSNSQSLLSLNMHCGWKDGSGRRRLMTFIRDKLEPSTTSVLTF